MLGGSWQGLPVVYADYQYTEQEGRNSETFSFSVVVVNIPLATPQVEVAPRGLLGRLVESVGSGAGLQFESEDFNHRFVVHCADPRFAYELIDARMMETLMQCDPGLHMTFGPSRALVWEQIQDPARVLDFFAGVTRWEVCGDQQRACGARYRMLMRVGSAEIGGLIEVVEFTPECDLAWTSVTGIDQRGRWRLRQAGGGRTRL